MDSDGDFDLAVAPKYSSQLYYYRNDGTSTAAAFTLVTATTGDNDGDPLANIASPSNTGWGVSSMPRPTFFDLDGDGDEDCLVGAATSMYFFLNVGGASSAAFRLAVGSENPFAEVLASSAFDGAIYFMPHLVDVDNDGDGDLVVATTGAGQVLEYFEVGDQW